jgi:hypothetical protein
MNRASIRALASQHTLPGGTYRGTLQGLANVCLFSRMRYKMFSQDGRARLLKYNAAMGALLMMAVVVVVVVSYHGLELLLDH